MIEIHEPGPRTTVQDPGRRGQQRYGIPPSGPMDAFAFVVANRLVGNDGGAAAIETTLSGPTLKFNCDAAICLGGAELAATLDGEPVPYWQPIQVKTGQVLSLGTVQGPGLRAYLAVQGGIDVPAYLGSRSTFTLGKFGGHAGRALRSGDVLHVIAKRRKEPQKNAIAPHLLPVLSHAWEIGVSTARMARPTSSRLNSLTHFSPRSGRCIIIPIRPASA